MPEARAVRTAKPEGESKRSEFNLLAHSYSWKVTVAVIWLAFSLALASWWLIFGLAQLTRFSQLSSQVGAAGPASAELARELARQHRMLLSEGGTLILLLFGGGVALLYHIRKEILRARKLREFFAAFTHDLKTSLASLRLQAESLEEDLRESGQERLMKRLVKDTVRLELQLENSLLLASPDDGSRFFIEVIRLADVLKPMMHHWPELDIEVDGDALVLGDHRALESIFKNLLQNAVIHGRATKVWIKIERTSSHATVRVNDNGRGFNGDLSRLGRMFERHGTSSGSGLGLYLATNLAKLLQGELRFQQEATGFGVSLVLPEAGLGATPALTSTAEGDA